jgi:hypothetical protein
MSGKKLSREEYARIEIGRTDISRSLSFLLSVFFLIAVFLVPVVQYAVDRRSGDEMALSFEAAPPAATKESFFGAINRKNKTVLKNIHLVETSLEDESLLRKLFLPPMQYILLRYLGQGNEKAVAGQDGWLFFSSGLDYLTGQPFLDTDQLLKREGAHDIWEKSLQPDPLKAIVGFKEQLGKRGIELIVVPIPIKAAIEPEKLTARTVTKPLVNRSWTTFATSLEQNGVHLFDARPLLAEYADRNGAGFLTTDTHWLPGAMQAVAKGLGDSIEKKYPAIKGSATYRLQQQSITTEGDIARMLTLPENTSLFPAQQVEISQVMSEENEFWQADRNAEILLLGDSFTNIYSLKGLGWGFGAGFAEHLSNQLRQPLDLLARNDSGAYVTREMLAMELKRGRDRLAGKKLVVWEFSERELALGDWKQIDLTLGEAGESTFHVVSSDEKLQVTAMVGAISRSPRPGSVPYRDNLVTMHLLDLRADGRQLESDQALVYGWGMRDNQLTEMAAIRPGDTVSLTLSSWEDVETEFGSYRRTPLDDEMMELELPNWGIVTDD